MLDLLTGGTGKLAILSGIIVAALSFLWSVFRAGRDKERRKNAEKELQNWSKADEIIGEADSARRIAAGDDIMSDDGFKRP